MHDGLLKMNRLSRCLITVRLLIMCRLVRVLKLNILMRLFDRLVLCLFRVNRMVLTR